MSPYGKRGGARKGGIWRNLPDSPCLTHMNRVVLPIQKTGFSLPDCQNSLDSNKFALITMKLLIKSFFKYSVSVSITFWSNEEKSCCFHLYLCLRYSISYLGPVQWGMG